MVNPRYLCRQHLLGEHSEIHKHRHNFVKKHNMSGRVEQIEPKKMKKRHDELVREMLSRGYKHNSPYEMPDISYLKDKFKVDRDFSLIDLMSRCEDCDKRIRFELESIIQYSKE